MKNLRGDVTSDYDCVYRHRNISLHVIKSLQSTEYFAIHLQLGTFQADVLEQTFLPVTQETFNFLRCCLLIHKLFFPLCFIILIKQSTVPAAQCGVDLWDKLFSL